jgi:hypothetical protein
MILDRGLVAAGDEDEMLDPGGPRLVDHVLHHGAVDHVHHLLRHRLGGGQEPGAEAGDRKNGFADTLHRRSHGTWIGRKGSVPRPEPGTDGG